LLQQGILGLGKDARREFITPFRHIVGPPLGARSAEGQFFNTRR